MSSAGHTTAWPGAGEPRAARERGVAEQFHAVRPTRLPEALGLLGPWARQRSASRLRSVTAADAAGVTFAGLLDGVAAAVVEGVFSAEELAILRSVATGTHVRWWGQPDDLQVLGLPWFAYAGRDEDAYRQQAHRVNGLVEQVAPGLHRRLTELCAHIQGEPVTLREGWAGPGLVAYPPAQAGTDGDIHFDWEGIVDEPGGLETESYSLISMVQSPETGGGLRVWGVCCDVAARQQPIDPEQAPVQTTIRYRPGDVAIIPGLDLHQIEAFEGSRSRICLTFHLARLQQGWRIWL